MEGGGPSPVQSGAETHTNKPLTNAASDTDEPATQKASQWVNLPTQDHLTHAHAPLTWFGLEATEEDIANQLPVEVKLTELTSPTLVT